MTLVEKINSGIEIIPSQIDNADDYNLYQTLWQIYRRNKEYKKPFIDCGINEDKIEAFVNSLRKYNQEYFNLESLRNNENQVELLELIISDLIIVNNFNYNKRFFELESDPNVILNSARAIESLINYMVKLNQSGLAVQEFLLDQFDLNLSQKGVDLYNNNLLALKVNFLMSQLVK